MSKLESATEFRRLEFWSEMLTLWKNEYSAVYTHVRTTQD